MNSLARKKYSSPMLVPINVPFDAEIAKEARSILSQKEALLINHGLIDICEKLWRGELGKETLYSLPQQFTYDAWAVTVNQLLDKKLADLLAAKGSDQ